MSEPTKGMKKVYFDGVDLTPYTKSVEFDEMKNLAVDLSQSFEGTVTGTWNADFLTFWEADETTLLTLIGKRRWWEFWKPKEYVIAKYEIQFIIQKTGDYTVDSTFRVIREVE